MTWAPVIQLRADGTVLMVAGPSGAVIPALSRNQALARESGLGGRIAEELVRAMVEGKVKPLDRPPAIPRALNFLSADPILNGLVTLPTTLRK